MAHLLQRDSNDLFASAKVGARPAIRPLDVLAVPAADTNADRDHARARNAPLQPPSASAFRLDLVEEIRMIGA